MAGAMVQEALGTIGSRHSRYCVKAQLGFSFRTYKFSRSSGLLPFSDMPPDFLTAPVSGSL